MPRRDCAREKISCLGFSVGGKKKRGVGKEVMERTRPRVSVSVGGREEVTEVRLQAGFSVCASEVFEGADGVYFSLVWEFSVACLCWEA